MGRLDRPAGPSCPPPLPCTPSSCNRSQHQPHQPQVSAAAASGGPVPGNYVPAAPAPPKADPGLWPGSARPSPDLGDAAVGGHHQDGGHLALQRAVQEGEALDVQHVHLSVQRDPEAEGAQHERWGPGDVGRGACMRRRLGEECQCSMCHHRHAGSEILSSTCARAHNGKQACLVDEEHAWDNFRLALLPPLGNLAVNLLADLQVVQMKTVRSR